MNLMRKAAPLGWFFMALLCAAVVVAGSVAWFFISIPSGADLSGCLTAQMYEVHLCKDDAAYVSLKQIAPAMRNAVIASEDAAFWDHKGIDWVELRKSFETNLEKGRMARGGSTITQQLAKNVYLSSEKSLLRKIREAVIAIRLERRYDKNLILEKYLNVVEFDKGVYGVKAAAKHYFDVGPSQLSIAQSAWLAFLLPNPKKYSVSFHKNKLTPFAFKQTREIIHRLWRFNKISETEETAAVREAKAFFGGLSGDSKELEEEFDRGGGTDDDSGADELSEDLGANETTVTSPKHLENVIVKPHAQVAKEAAPNEESPAENASEPLSSQTSPDEGATETEPESE
ncbi:hypothetical protein BH10BDE1_BH10BDE1_20870 [soil metagenome]